MNELGTFIATYGYWAVLAGTLLEGETVLLAAGYAAHRGLLDWRLVIVVASLGGTLGDQIAFALGRWRGSALLARFPFLARQAPSLHRLLERYHLSLILVIRFLYGLRIAGPMMLGTTRLGFLRFSALNAIGAVLWAIIVTGLGYSFALVLENLVSHVERIEQEVLVGILATGVAFGLWRSLGHRHRKNTPPPR